MDKDLQSIYRKTGVFVFLAVLILLFLVLFIAQKQRTFSRKYVFHTLFDDAMGLEKTSPITFKGTEIGKVRAFSFNAERNIEVDFHIFSEFRDLIVENSAITKNANPLGGRAALEFLMGPPEGELADEHTIIPSLDMEAGRRLLAERKIRTRGDQISQIVANLGTFVENLNRDNNYDQGSFFRMLYHLAFVVENVNHTLVNANTIMASLQKDHQQADGVFFRLMVNVADLTEDFRVTNSLIAQNMLNLNTLLENYSDPEDLIPKLVDPSGENLFNPVRQSLEAMTKNLEDVNQLIEFFQLQSPEIAILLSETKGTLAELQKTLQGINNNPLLRGGIRRDEVPVSGERIRPMEGE